MVGGGRRGACRPITTRARVRFRFRPPLRATTRAMAVTAARPAHPTALDRRFRFTERRTTLRTEALGGLSTFLTMSYILFVNPAILSAAKVPAPGSRSPPRSPRRSRRRRWGCSRTCRSRSRRASGINAVVAFDIVLAQGHPWPVAMACIVLEGVLALVLVLAGLREAVVNAVPDSLKLSIGVGIGLFITLVGLRAGRDRRQRPGDRHRPRRPQRRAAADRARGIFAAAALVVRGVRGALLAGSLVSTVARPGLRRARLAGQDRGVARARPGSRRSATRSTPSNLARRAHARARSRRSSRCS